MSPPALPHATVRDAVASAVHRAIADSTGGDGFGYCYLYAYLGWRLLREEVGRPYLLQAGSLRLLAPPAGWLAMDTSPGDLASGAFHCWLARPHPDGAPSEVVDLAARHYGRWVASWPGWGTVHPRPSPPWEPPCGAVASIWCTRPFPDWLSLQAEELASRNYLASLKRAEPGLAPMVERARLHLRAALPMSLFRLDSHDR